MNTCKINSTINQRFSDNHCNAAPGFTLIEICIVLIIAGLMTAAFVRFADVTLQQVRQQQLKTGITDLQTALTAFENKNGRLPCAAPIDVPPTDPTYGRETACDGTAHSGTKVVNGRVEGGKPLKVRIGAIPTRDLDIADSAMLDPWSRRVTYAVTEANAADGQATGGITVTNAAGKSITSSPGNARYVLFSHGRDGAGAYSVEGKQFAACGNTKDKENCDNQNAAFIAMDRNDSVDAQHYDDYLAYNVTSATLGLDTTCKFHRVTGKRVGQFYSWDFYSPGTAAGFHPPGGSQLSAPAVITYPSGTLFNVNIPWDQNGLPPGWTRDSVIPTDGSYEEHKMCLDSWTSTPCPARIISSDITASQKACATCSYTTVVCQSDGRWHVFDLWLNTNPP